jgi:hypothetical protein
MPLVTSGEPIERAEIAVAAADKSHVATAGDGEWSGFWGELRALTMVAIGP